MTVTKAVVRGILLASLASTSARGGPILTLGVTSGNWPTAPVSAFPAPVAVPSDPVALASAMTPTLRLAVYSDPGPSPVFASPPPTPARVQAPALLPASPPPAVSPSPVVDVAPAAPASGRYDALINLGSGPYPGSASFTTGSPQPWFLGAGVDRLFGGVPSLSQALAFDATVLQRVQQTFALGGVPVNLTDDPNAPAAHTISVVSRTGNPSLPGALGMSSLGGNGFQYVDVAAGSASSVDQLEWIVAHNVAHELMLTFHVPEVHDQSGRYVDSPDASWSMMTSPSATFSPGALADLLSRDFQAVAGPGLDLSAQLLGAPTVPEPSALLLWAAIGSAGLVALRARAARRVNLP